MKCPVCGMQLTLTHRCGGTPAVSVQAKGMFDLNEVVRLLDAEQIEALLSGIAQIVATNQPTGGSDV